MTLGPKCRSAEVSWNSLPDYVVEVNSINMSKSRLDKLWADQDIVYNFNSELTGTVDRSVRM